MLLQITINVKTPLFIWKYQWQLDNKIRVMRSHAKKKLFLVASSSCLNSISLSLIVWREGKSSGCKHG
ncbi:hypothetical protein [Nostoc sp.]|uniref:hypothetical protein n=1 Tax=Nostoc sp. TaxID=1180 RepID=UPI002FF93549